MFRNGKWIWVGWIVKYPVDEFMDYELLARQFWTEIIWLLTWNPIKITPKQLLLYKQSIEDLKELWPIELEYFCNHIWTIEYEDIKELLKKDYRIKIIKDYISMFVFCHKDTEIESYNILWKHNRYLLWESNHRKIDEMFYEIFNRKKRPIHYEDMQKFIKKIFKKDSGIRYVKNRLSNNELIKDLWEWYYYLKPNKTILHKK